MSAHRFAPMVSSAVAALMLAVSPAAFAEDLPVTPSGKPDLNGIWTNRSLTGLSRPAGVDKLVVTPEEAQKIAENMSIAGVSREDAGDPTFSDPNAPAPPKGSQDFGLKGYDAFWVDPGQQLAKVKGEIRTSYIVDPPSGAIPWRDPAAVQRARTAGGIRYVTGVGGNEGPEAPPLPERCLIGFGNTGGPGMLSVLYNNTYQFVLTPDHLMVLVEMNHDARVVPLFKSEAEATQKHRPGVMARWLGDSVGWWEGDTLVVQTKNVRPEQASASSIPLSPEGKMKERFTRISADEIFYQFEVEDPNYYSKPWKAELSFYKTEGPVYEYACHEGNYAMPGILGGARVQEAKAAAAK
ncbi:hypothetical protein GC169_12155 [bacterium]|nr:hypothetical protein [bacterium]